MANNKLYPPYIEGAIPSFFGLTMTVPYSLNRAVPNSAVKGFALKIKSVQNYFITTLKSDTNTFTFEEGSFRIGESYKVQLACIDSEGQEGYYSTVGIIKYTKQPEVTIDGLNKEAASSHQYDYIGRYFNEDQTEKVYSYNFKIYDINNKVIANSGELLHNSSADTEQTESCDTFSHPRDIASGTACFIQYTVTTINNMVCASPLYRIQQQHTIAPDLDAKLVADMNIENGYVDLSLQTNKSTLATGAFRIMRAQVKETLDWEEIYRFYFVNKNPNMRVFRDFTVKQGETYIYSIQQYANKLYSDRILSNEIFVDFEDAFLFDGERQLKIKYNPKISSFKTTLLESKSDTLGSKYPFIFRNGNVEYKEFPISGLISYWMDDEDLFVTKEFKDVTRASTISKKSHRTNLTNKTTNLTGENIYHEREFKLEVLNWLNNGEVKLFRSPTEGNYMVRLMNVSLAPNDSVGRMLHTFNATAYEVAEYNYNNLNIYNMISIEEPSTESYYWKTVIIENTTSNKNEEIIFENISAFTLEDAVPGDKFNIDNETIIIGATGTYKAKGDSLTISFTRSMLNQGHLTYQYKAAPEPTFALIKDIEIKDCALKQFIGEHNDIISKISDVRTEILKYYRLSFRLRPVVTITELNEITDEYMIYKLDKTYYDGYLYAIGKDAIIDYDTTFKIDKDLFNIENTRILDVYDIDTVNHLSIGSGIIAELSYQYRISNYHLEEDNTVVKKAKQDYEDAYNDYSNKLTVENGYLDSEEMYKALINVENAYENYVNILTQEIDKYKEEWGIK